MTIKNSGISNMFMALVVVYFLMFLLVFIGTTSFRNFFAWDIRIIQKIATLLFLIFVIYFLRFKNFIVIFDFAILLLPMFVLMLLVVFFGAKSGSTLYLIEVPVTILISLLPSIKLFMPDKQSLQINIAILVIESLMVVCLHVFSPVIGD